MTMRQKRRNSRGRVSSRRYSRRRFRRQMERIIILLVILLMLILVIGGAMILRNDQTKTEPEEDPEPVIADTADPEVEEVEEEEPIIIIVDPGHGGTDQGTCSKDILEKDVNLSVAKKLVRKLERDGVKIVMTREADEKVKLGERVTIANDQKANLFVSIHCNYCEEDRSVKGLECYYQEGSMDGKALAESIAQAFEGEDTIVNRGTRTGDLKVLRETEMPAALVEIGFLSNKGDCQLLMDEEYQDLLAQKIAEGVLEELSL